MSGGCLASSRISTALALKLQKFSPQSWRTITSTKCSTQNPQSLSCWRRTRMRCTGMLSSVRRIRWCFCALYSSEIMLRSKKAAVRRSPIPYKSKESRRKMAGRRAAGCDEEENASNGKQTIAKVKWTCAGIGTKMRCLLKKSGGSQRRYAAMRASGQIVMQSGTKLRGNLILLRMA